MRLHANALRQFWVRGTQLTGTRTDFRWMNPRIDACPDHYDTGTAADVTRIKLVVPLFPIVDGKLNEAKAVSSAVLLKDTLELVLRSAPLSPDVEMPASEGIPFYISVLSGRCGKASISLEFSNADINAFTLNERGWLKLLIEGKPKPGG